MGSERAMVMVVDVVISMFVGCEFMVAWSLLELESDDQVVLGHFVWTFEGRHSGILGR